MMSGAIIAEHADFPFYTAVDVIAQEYALSRGFNGGRKDFVGQPVDGGGMVVAAAGKVEDGRKLFRPPDIVFFPNRPNFRVDQSVLVVEGHYPIVDDVERDYTSALQPVGRLVAIHAEGQIDIIGNLFCLSKGFGRGKEPYYCAEQWLLGLFSHSLRSLFQWLQHANKASLVVRFILDNFVITKE